MKNGGKHLRLAAAATVLLLALVACGSDETAPPTPTGTAARSATPASAVQPRWSIEDAKQFREFPLYWLGESYEGLPLTEIIRYRYDPEPPIPPIEAENSVTFIYGDCDPPPDGGCAPPLTIVLDDYCLKPPERISSSVKNGPPFDVRGGLAQYIGGDHVRLWTGNVSIAIFTEGAVSQVEAAEQLRLVSEGPEGAQMPLGPPNASC